MPTLQKEEMGMDAEEKEVEMQTLLGASHQLSELPR